MTRESLLKVYVGNKLMRSHFPVLVVVGDNSRADVYYGEHYLFADVPRLSFVFRRNIVSPRDANPGMFDFDKYPQIFSAEALLKSQFTAARAHLEFAFSTLDMKAFKETFWEGRTFAFEECDDYPLVRFHVSGQYENEMSFMFKFSRSSKMRELKERMARLPKIKIQEDSGNEAH